MRLFMSSIPNMINGQPAAINASFAVMNPATLQEAGRAPEASLADLDKAVTAAGQAFLGWSQLEDTKRQDYCMQVAAKLEENSEELARLITLEQGKPLDGAGSRFEVGGGIAWTQYTAALEMPIEVLQDNADGRIEMHRKPLGVVGSITPWNWPLMIAVWHILPAIRAGNTVVCKPSPLAPLATLRMIELMNEVLPAGVVNSITGPDELGAAMSNHPDIQKIVFTGSIGTGKRVMNSAAETLKRLTLELGGNDAGIVLDDADPKAIAEDLFWGAFINNGQTCAALKRLYVHESIYAAVCKELVEFAKTVKTGDGFAADVQLGPLQNQMQFNKVNKLIKESIAHGGKVLIGGAVDAENTLFIPATLVATNNPADPLINEEQFGPALPIIPYSNLDDAIAAANNSENGLGGSVWSSNSERAKEVALRLECGSVWINKHGAIQPNVPFGGVKSSGLGVEFGMEGLLANTSIQAVFL